MRWGKRNYRRLNLEQLPPIPLLDILIQYHLELLDDPVALQRSEQLAVHVHRSLGLLKRARQRDPDVRVLALARPIHDATHHRELQLLDACELLLPLRHLLHEIALNPLRQFLEIGRSRPSTSRATRDLWHEAPDSERLQNLLPTPNLLRAIPTRSRRQAHANRIPNSRKEQPSQPRSPRHHPLPPPPGLGQPKVQSIVATPRQFRVHIDQVPHTRDLRAQDDLVPPQPISLRSRRIVHSRHHHRLHHHVASGQGIGRLRILIHHLRQESLIK